MCALLLNPSLSFAAHTQTRSNRAAAAAVQRKRQTPRRAAPAEPAPCRALALPAETPQIFLLQGVRRHYFSHGKSGVGIYVWGGERECKRERAMRAEGWQGCGGLARPCFSIFRAIIIPLIDICAHTSARRHFASNWIQESTYLLTPQIKNKNSTNFHSSVCTDSPGCISFARACLPIMTTNLVVSSHARAK